MFKFLLFQQAKVMIKRELSKTFVLSDLLFDWLLLFAEVCLYLLCLGLVFWIFGVV